MVTQIADSVIKELRCLDDRLSAIQRLLSYEYGQPIREVYGHDPRRLPFVGRLQVPPGTSQTIDFTVALAKPATRGHLTNLGTAAVALHFTLTNAQLGINQEVGPYVLAPNTTLDISFFVEALRVSASATVAADLQFLVQ